MRDAALGPVVEPGGLKTIPCLAGARPGGRGWGPANAVAAG